MNSVRPDMRSRVHVENGLTSHRTNFLTVSLSTPAVRAPRLRCTGATTLRRLQASATRAARRCDRRLRGALSCVT